MDAASAQDADSQSIAQRHSSIRERLSKRKQQLGLLTGPAACGKKSYYVVKFQLIRISFDLGSSSTSAGDETKEPFEFSAPGVSGRKKAKSEDAGVAVEDLLREPTAKEKESMRLNTELLELLAKPTVKELSTVEKFRSDGTQVKEFCPHGTKENCASSNSHGRCQRLHFRKIIQKHTDESLGDCSFLNTCFHMTTCKYIHYEIDYDTATPSRTSADEPIGNSSSTPSAAAGEQPQSGQSQRARRISGSSTHSALTDVATTTGSLVKAQVEQPTILFPPQVWAWH